MIMFYQIDPLIPVLYKIIGYHNLKCQMLPFNNETISTFFILGRVVSVAVSYK